jgi:NADH-quinone oxidoreductase subunit M
VVGPLVAAILVLGFWPGPALDLVRDPAQATREAVGVEDPPPVVELVMPVSDEASETTDGSGE